MPAFIETPFGASVPAKYKHARVGLRLRILDVSVGAPHDDLMTTPVGEELMGALTWGAVGVTSDLLATWGVSIDEAMATAKSNIANLPVQRENRRAGDAVLDITVGHLWVSSLILRRSAEATTDEGFLAVIPRADVLVTTPVIGAETIDGLESMILLGEDQFNSTAVGLSPHVWWWYNDKYLRVTDYDEHGRLDLLTSSNVCAYHLANSIRHLASPCDECGRG